MTNTRTVAQKKHDKAIRITDIAINKVPGTHIHGFTTEQNLFIQDKHKELLRTAKELCKRYKSNEMEAIILVDAHTWQYWIVEGKVPRKVDIADDKNARQALQTGRKNSLLLLHNHPSGGTFSGTDFLTFCYNESVYLMSIVGNDGSVYLLLKDANFDANEALSEYAKLVAQNADKKDRSRLAMRTILKQPGNYGLIYKKGRKKL